MFAARVVYTILAVSLIVLLTACSESEPPPVVDAPAHDLDVRVMILDIDPGVLDVPVSAQFFQDGHLVQLGSSASVYCEGVQLKAAAGIYAYQARVKRRPSGTDYEVAYVHPSGIRVASIQTRDRPAIMSPAAQSQVARSSSFSISYAPSSSAGVRGIVGDGSSAVGGNPDEQTDSGVYENIDIQSLKAGPGTVNIARTYKGQLVSTGGYKSVSYEYHISSVNVEFVLK
jgi:hypothetical protein